MANKSIQTSKDALWKGIIHDLFEDFMGFYFPEYIHLIDFGQKVVFLDKELAELSPPAASGGRRADMLAKILLKDGNERWLLIHIEVQGYEDNEFDVRMFQYYYRIWDKYQKPITAIAIFTDENAEYHPKKYEIKTWKTQLSYQYHSVKILGMSKETLEQSQNPFAIVCETVLLAIEKKNEKEEVIFKLKTELARKLLIKGHDKDKIRILMNFLVSYQKFNNFTLNLQFKQTMDTITSLLSNPYPQTLEEFILMDAERQGIEQGLEQGLEQGKLESAFNVLQRIDMPVEEAVAIFGLSKGQIQELKARVKENNAQKLQHQPIQIEENPKNLFHKLLTYLKNITKRRF